MQSAYAVHIHNIYINRVDLPLDRHAYATNEGE